MLEFVGAEYELDSMEFTDIPRDDVDERYVKSFRVEEEDSIKHFFDEYGFVVINSVFDSEVCDATVSAMWDICEELNPGLARDNVGSWDSLKSSGKYGLSSRGPSFHPQLLRNRQNENLITALEMLIGSPVLVSQDRSVHD